MSIRTHDGVKHRNADRRSPSPPPGWENDPHADVLSVRGVDVDLSGLSEREREVWRSVELHGYRPRDLAAETGAEPSTIRTLLDRARRKQQ